MTSSPRTKLFLLFGVLASFLGWSGCDRGEKRAAEEQALRDKPPVQTGNVSQAMAREPATPRLPTPGEQLMTALRRADRSEVESWLSTGHTLDPPTPVLVAAVRGRGDLAFIEWLIELGAGVDVPDAAGRTPLSWAAARGSLQVVDYLLDHGANVEASDQLGRTPLHYAVFSTEEEVVSRLLDAKANVNAQDSLGTTPLMYACSKNQPAIVKTLRVRGADATIKDTLGRTAAERAHGDDNPCTK